MVVSMTTLSLLQLLQWMFAHVYINVFNPPIPPPHTHSQGSDVVMRILHKKELGCHATTAVTLKEEDEKINQNTRKDLIFWDMLGGKKAIKGETRVAMSCDQCVMSCDRSCDQHVMFYDRSCDQCVMSYDRSCDQCVMSYD